MHRKLDWMIYDSLSMVTNFLINLTIFFWALFIFCKASSLV
ncbi:hypothetical protein MXB_5019 [Myxobolus squamalis]|nr:hypothetical protein MXB_5019 [Myxobolus squamalis]